jgi:hypothetical protein
MGKYWQIDVGPAKASTIVMDGDATNGFTVIVLFLTGPDTPQMFTCTTERVRVPVAGPKVTVTELVPCPDAMEPPAGGVHVKFPVGKPVIKYATAI